MSRDRASDAGQCLLCLAGARDVTDEHFFLPGLFASGPFPRSGHKPHALSCCQMGSRAFPWGFCVLTAFFFWIPQAPNNTICGLAQTTPHGQPVPTALLSARRADIEQQKRQEKDDPCVKWTPYHEARLCGVGNS